MCLTMKSDCTLTRISPLLPNTVIYVFSLSPHFLPCSLPPYTNLGFFLYYHISCAQYKCFKTCISSIDSFQCLGKFGTGEPMVYSSKFTNISTPPWRDSMFSCQWVYFSFFAFRAGSRLIRKFCVCGVGQACSSLSVTVCNTNWQLSV